MSIDYDPVFLPFDLFPSDPNRGIDIPPSHGTFTCTGDITSSSSIKTVSSSSPTPVRIYSSSILLMPPVPDMSMPLNVISLVGTFYAFIIGFLMKQLLDRATTKIKDQRKGKKSKNKMQKLVGRIKKKIARFRRKQGAESN
mmetsp:Transcript_42918/g.64668  ORF Transcript_42918/g.64668 Transcript_42918/m.64668 type:complete len:141 (+) Transcript_42918:244-666(+)